MSRDIFVTEAMVPCFMILSVPVSNRSTNDEWCPGAVKAGASLENDHPMQTTESWVKLYMYTIVSLMQVRSEFRHVPIRWFVDKALHVLIFLSSGLANLPHEGS